MADLVLFDPATVIDRATIDLPEAPPAGIPAVMVAGEWVILQGNVTGAHPGRVPIPARAVEGGSDQKHSRTAQ